MRNVPYEKFAELLLRKSRLYQKCIRTANVCNATGIAPATISAWKAGTYTPKADKLMKLAEYFDVPLEYFLKEE